MSQWYLLRELQHATQVMKESELRIEVHNLWAILIPCRGIFRGGGGSGTPLHLKNEYKNGHGCQKFRARFVWIALSNCMAGLEIKRGMVLRGKP